MKYPFLQNDVIIDTKNYPLLDGYCSASGKKMKISNNFSIHELHPAIADELDKFLKESSLKTALKKSFGISSPPITEAINKLMFSETKEHVEVNFNYWLIFDMLSTLFLKQEKPNHSDFLKFLTQFYTNRTVLATLAPHFNLKLQMQKLLNDNFTESQKCEILNNSTYKDEVKDMLAMYLQNDEYLNNTLKMNEFKNINNFRKIHDIFAKENAKLKTKDFSLNQEQWYPQINKLNEGEGKAKNFQFLIPKSHHVLIDWGQTLGHCIGSRHYATDASMGKCLLLGIATKSENIDYTLEIRSRRINQIQGFSGTRPNATTMKELEIILRKLELVD
jgi:hypothetical protein